MNHRKIKEQRIAHLLKIMKTEPLTVNQMAEEINTSHKTASSYLTELRFHKKVFIARYERRSTGTPLTYYQTGNLPDVEKLAKISMEEYNRRYREKTKLDREVKPFVPRMDIAAAWMRNPI